MPGHLHLCEMLLGPGVPCLDNNHGTWSHCRPVVERTPVPVVEDARDDTSEDHLMRDSTAHSTREEVGPYRPHTSPVSSWESSPLVMLCSTESLRSTIGFEHEVYTASPLREDLLQHKKPRPFITPKVWLLRVCGMTLSSPDTFAGCLGRLGHDGRG